MSGDSFFAFNIIVSLGVSPSFHGSPVVFPLQLGVAIISAFNVSPTKAAFESVLLFPIVGNTTQMPPFASIGVSVA